MTEQVIIGLLESIITLLDYLNKAGMTLDKQDKEAINKATDYAAKWSIVNSNGGLNIYNANNN